MADVLTTIGLKDDEFTGGLSRLEAFVNNFRRRMESAPIKMSAESSGNWRADNPLYWSRIERQQYIRQAAWERRGQDIGAVAGEVGGLYSSASAVAMMVTEGARYIDQLEHASRQHIRWKQEIDAVGDSYFKMLNRAKLAADPVRAGSILTAVGGYDAANDATKTGQKQLEELGTLYSVLNTPRNVWEKSYQNAINAQREGNRIAGVASRQAGDQKKGDEAESQRKIREDIAAAVEERLKSGQEATGLTFQTFDKNFRERDTAEQARDRLRFEEMSNRAMIERLSGREKEANLLDARVQYETKLAELMRDQNATEEEKTRNAASLAEIYRLQTGAIAAAGRPQMLVRAFSMSDAGGSATLAAALATGTQTQQKSLESIEKTSKESADSLRQIKYAVSQGAMRAVWN